MASTSWIAPCHARKAPANTATIVDGSRRHGTAPVAPGWKRVVSAPHSISSTRSAGTLSGRIFALGVTIRSAWLTCQLRQRRIGCAMSARSSAALGEPG
jgi:hypothetical protein